MKSGTKSMRPAYLLFAVWILLSAGCGRTQEALLYVNGEAVAAEELSLLGDDVDEAVRMKVLQQWAREAGVTDTAFSYEEFLTELSRVNEERLKRKETGGVVYGMTEYTPLQFYSIQMGEYERALKDKIMQEASEEELLVWYEEHMEDYWEFGEIVADVTAWEDSRAVYEEEVILAPYNLRTLSEQDEMLADALLALEPGETDSWTDEYGIEWTATCKSREEGTYQPFAEVQGAVAEQYAGGMLVQELADRISVSEILDLREDET